MFFKPCQNHTRMNIHVKTYGCAHNMADSERMSGLLVEEGHQLVDEKEADLVVINSCAAKSPAEQRCFHDIDNAKKKGQKVVVAGCVPQSMRTHPRLQDVAALGPRNLQDITTIVDAAALGNNIRKFATRGNPALALPKIRRNPHVEIVPINTGCLGSCTFCKTVHARGRLTSYPKEAIRTTVQQAVDEGIKEIWLTSEDLGAYGRDIGTNIVTLLKSIATLRGDFTVRLGMANPPFIQEHIKELATIMQRYPQRFYHFFHIPLQAASDNVLKEMNREYTVDEFLACVRLIRENLPEATIATDIIAGFPSETEEDFQKTLELLKQEQFPIVNINRFYSRPNTPAARMQQLPTKTLSARCKQLTILRESYSPYTHLIGTKQEVLFTEQGKNNTAVGKNPQYIQVVVPNKDILGTKQMVRVTKAAPHYLVGELI